MASKTTYLDLYYIPEENSEKEHLITIIGNQIETYPLMFKFIKNGSDFPIIFNIQEVDQIIKALIQFRIDWENNNDL